MHEISTAYVIYEKNILNFISNQWVEKKPKTPCFSGRLRIICYTFLEKRKAKLQKKLNIEKNNNNIFGVPIV